MRDAESPNGSLSDEEIYEVWYNAKDSGIISEDDAIPSRAMQHVAQELGYEHPEDDRMLPREIYNEVIEEVDERIGSGREKLEQQNSSKEFYLNQGEGPAVYGGRESDTPRHKPRSTLIQGYPL